ncbi:MAG TPA: DUF2203 domain-containing protein [Anaerolineales bacterium]|nr:DUF2203 domain-containing protein [Anaerolineales bacterium]
MAETFPHLFTTDEAEALLVSLRPLVDDMVECRARLVELQPSIEPVLQKLLGNGGSKATGELLTVFQKLKADIRAIEALGVFVKDIETGLIDFPSKRGDTIVFLCWRQGEPHVAHWHDLESGVAGRQPL